MDDVKALVERLGIIARHGVARDDCLAAADILEAQAAEIDRLRDELTRIASGRYDWHAMRRRAALVLTERGADAQPPALTGEENR